MGLFDKILKNVASKIKEEVMNKLDETVSSSSSSSASENTSVQKVDTSKTKAPSKDYSLAHNTDDSYFAAMLTDDKFPGYTIEKAVHPKVFDSNAHEKCFPISYLFKNNGTPVLAVFVMNLNQRRAMISVGSYDVLDNNNIKYIRFYKGMKNEESYVLNRIRENL